MADIKTIEDLNRALVNSEGYMIGITLLNEGKLEHHLMMSKFPRLDLLPSAKHIKELIIESLEKSVIEDELSE